MDNNRSVQLAQSQYPSCPISLEESLFMRGTRYLKTEISLLFFLSLSLPLSFLFSSLSPAPCLRQIGSDFALSSGAQLCHLLVPFPRRKDSMKEEGFEAEIIRMSSTVAAVALASGEADYVAVHRTHSARARRASGSLPGEDAGQDAPLPPPPLAPPPSPPPPPGAGSHTLSSTEKKRYRHERTGSDPQKAEHKVTLAQKKT